MPILNFDWTGIVFNINETVDKALDLLNEASDNGANVVMFPELWFPGYVTTAESCTQNYTKLILTWSMQIPKRKGWDLVHGVSAQLH